MEDKAFEQLSVIRDQMLENPNVEGLLIWNAAKLALEDKYLYDLMLDWALQTNESIKDELLTEVGSYTYETLRKMGIKH